MGLDMYLSKKIYVGANYEHNKVEGVIELTKDSKPLQVNLKKVKYIEEEAAYWRKANQIHKWFVDNVQNGEDDCGEYDVSNTQLQELVDLCKKVLEVAKVSDGQIVTSETMGDDGWVKNYTPGKIIQNQEEIHELLPTTSGFFFGGTDYDEYYLQDIKDTIEQLEPLLQDKMNDYVYSSSW